MQSVSSTASLSNGARLELRVAADTKDLWAHAANLEGVSLAAFVRNATDQLVAEVLARHEQTTTVSPQFFDQLLQALDDPNPQPVPALQKGFAKLAQTMDNQK